MGPLKKHLTPIGKGPIVKHTGKGSAPFPPQPKPGPLTQAAPGMNNYAKATPMPMPAPSIGGAPGASISPSLDSPGQAQGMV